MLLSRNVIPWFTPIQNSRQVPWNIVDVKPSNSRGALLKEISWSRVRRSWKCVCHVMGGWRSTRFFLLFHGMNFGSISFTVTFHTFSVAVQVIVKSVCIYCKEPAVLSNVISTGGTTIRQYLRNTDMDVHSPKSFFAAVQVVVKSVCIL
jgi:hypothetical protein